MSNFIYLCSHFLIKDTANEIFIECLFHPRNYFNFYFKTQIFEEIEYLIHKGHLLFLHYSVSSPVEEEEEEANFFYLPTSLILTDIPVLIIILILQLCT